MTRKKYQGTTEDFEAKLARVMERLGVEHYDYNWSQSRDGGSCYVEMRYNGRAYRFENSAKKSEACGRGLVYVSDLFGAVVYSLEGLARAVEQGIFTLDMLLEGVPTLPDAAPQVESCFTALGFTVRPASAEEVKARYRKLAQVVHPDNGGSAEEFTALKGNYDACLELMEDGDG